MGYFTELDLRSLDDDGQFEVLNDTFYTDMDISYKVPAGFITDLASIPRVLRGIFKQTGKSRKPAVFHDHMYETKWKTRKECDKMFYRMLCDRGMSSWKAKLYYWGVRAGGWTRGRW